MPFCGKHFLEDDTMNELAKITDVSTTYALTARTLRYYEDIGLLASTRTEDYAHRMYDEAAITRLQQIIILRKLNISIKDIKRIFSAPGSEVVLDVLGKKAEDIDDEMALLHELKNIVVDFINQIRQSDFNNDAEVKQLYDKAKEIEAHLSTAGYSGNASTNRLLEVAEKLEEKRLTTPIAVNAYRQCMNGSWRFIGKKYASGAEAWADQPDAWNTDSDDSLFQQLKVNPSVLYEDGNPQDGKSLIGLITHPNGDNSRFAYWPEYGSRTEPEYWLGFFTPENTPVPPGYNYIDFPQMDIGCCWVYGHDMEVFDAEFAFTKLKNEGFRLMDDWWFERYVDHRETKDKNGYRIMDICFFVKPIS